MTLRQRYRHLIDATSVRAAESDRATVLLQPPETAKSALTLGDAALSLYQVLFRQGGTRAITTEAGGLVSAVSKNLHLI